LNVLRVLPAEHPARRERTRGEGGIKAVAELGLPRLGGHPPFPLRPFSFAPAETVTHAGLDAGRQTFDTLEPSLATFGNTLTEDAHTGKSFHYMLSNPQHEPGSVDRLEGASGKITDEELERERGGSGLRYSFDIKSGGITQCVGTPRKAHTPTERELDGRIVVQTSGSPRPGEACGFSWSPASPRPCTIRGPSRRRGLDSIDG